MRLTFAELRIASLERLKHFKNSRGEAAHSEPDGSDWSISDWLTATMGELGEFANIIKKTRRGDLTLNEAKQDLADELADVQCYLMLLSERCGIDLEQAVIDKFNAVSKRVGSSVTLTLENRSFVSLEEMELEKNAFFQDTKKSVDKLEADHKRLKSAQSKRRWHEGLAFLNAQTFGINHLIFIFRNRHADKIPKETAGQQRAKSK